MHPADGSGADRGFASTTSSDGVMADDLGGTAQETSRASWQALVEARPWRTGRPRPFVPVTAELVSQETLWAAPPAWAGSAAVVLPNGATCPRVAA